MKKLFVLGMASVFALSGCYGLSKCSFDEFKEAASKTVEKAPEVDYVSYNGKYDGEKIKFSTNQGLASYSAKEAAVALALGSIDRVDSMYLVENSNATYYKGFGYKVADSSVKYEYSMKGFLAKVDGKINGKEFSFLVSHTFKK